MEQLCLQLVLSMTIPFSKENQEISDKEAAQDVIDQINEAFEAMEIENVEILEKNIYKC